MRARLMFAGSVISLLVLVSGCGDDTSQPTEPASNGSDVIDPAPGDSGPIDPGPTDPLVTEPKAPEPEVQEPEEFEPKSPPVLNE